MSRKEIVGKYIWRVCFLFMIVFKADCVYCATIKERLIQSTLETIDFDHVFAIHSYSVYLIVIHCDLKQTRVTPDKSEMSYADCIFLLQKSSPIRLPVC